MCVGGGGGGGGVRACVRACVCVCVLSDFGLVLAIGRNDFRGLLI